MSHITSIGAGVFSDIAVAVPTTEPAFAGLDTAAEFAALFATEIDSNGGTKAANTFLRIRNIREFPSFGTPANIVNVPVYGQKNSQQIQAQSDTPNLEVTLNFVPADWANTTLLGAMVGDGKRYVFRMTLLNAEPTGSGATKWASVAAGIGTVENSSYYFIGKLEALMVTPSLSDSNTATLTLSTQSAFFGAYTAV